ncbi:PKD domain-containing protein [uncultured Methanoregula sp.]|uniref:PKD domain-containing protein n=1 Tax=uncultured Methanoregula sp. TaxID=1005933 RepID=UPI002AAACD80|nr:PKD domain-containing protein [uncultured Methanoregula sp.]
MKKNVVLIAAFMLLTITVTGFVVLSNIQSYGLTHHTDELSYKWVDDTISRNNLHLNLLGQSNYITIHALLPEVPASFPMYKGTLLEGDAVYLSPGDSMSPKNKVISEEDAPGVAEQIMASYGGLPKDARLVLVNTSYLKKMSSDTGEVLEKWPVSTSVVYNRNLMGLPIVGDGDRIAIDLGENGELLEIYKIWRTLEYTGFNVSIISPPRAVEKLQNGESINHLMSDQGIVITNITLGIYEKSRTDPKIFLEPIWIFSGTTPSRDRVSLYVYARQFANLTATPISGKVPLNVTFTDISDASPTKWLWNFGDGINSTERNPVHQYTAAGTYNISLKVWNDLGSDMMEKTGYITVRNPAPPIANFTATPLSGVKPLKVTFNDTSANGPAGWMWNFGDGTNSTEQHPVHIYTSAGNFTVSLNVMSRDGSNSTVKSDYIRVTSQPPTTIPTTAVTIKPTTKPTPIKTHAPLSPLVAIAGVTAVGAIYIFGARRAP